MAKDSNEVRFRIVFFGLLLFLASGMCAVIFAQTPQANGADVKPLASAAKTDAPPELTTDQEAEMRTLQVELQSVYLQQPKTISTSKRSKSPKTSKRKSLRFPRTSIRISMPSTAGRSSGFQSSRMLRRPNRRSSYHFGNLTVRAKQEAFAAVKEESDFDRRLRIAHKWVEVLQAQVTRLDEDRAKVEKNLDRAKQELIAAESAVQNASTIQAR
jgi:hypothetical protein